MHNTSEPSHVAILHRTKMIKDESRKEYVDNGNCPITRISARKLLLYFYYTIIWGLIIF